MLSCQHEGYATNEEHESENDLMTQIEVFLLQSARENVAPSIDTTSNCDVRSLEGS